MSVDVLSNPLVAELLGNDLATTIRDTFTAMEVAEDEIAKARGEDAVDRDDPLWQSFALLRPTHDRMTVEYVYRAHCGELLQRVRDRHDTRPATDVEILLAISDASMTIPLERGLAALMVRMFERRLPEQFARLGVDRAMYVDEESAASEWEVKLRSKGVEWRQ